MSLIKTIKVKRIKKYLIKMKRNWNYVCVCVWMCVCVLQTWNWDWTHSCWPAWWILSSTRAKHTRCSETMLTWGQPAVPFYFSAQCRQEVGCFVSGLRHCLGNSEERNLVCKLKDKPSCVFWKLQGRPLSRPTAPAGDARTRHRWVAPHRTLTWRGEY